VLLPNNACAKIGLKDYLLQTKIKTSKAFTIIELLVVMVVIGILASITMVVYTGIQARAHDISVQSDLDRMDALETNYSLKTNTPGKNYYSPNGVDGDLDFVPSGDNVVQVVVNSTDYCIRGYNVDGTKNSIDNSLIKESTPGACAIIVAVELPSSAPSVSVGLNGANVQATISPVTCVKGTVQYSTKNRIDDGAWTSYSDWSSNTSASQTANEGVKYGYIAQARCFVDDALFSTALEGAEGTYYNPVYDSLPLATSISGYWATAPDGYLIEDGTAVSRTTYSDLFAVIGTTYGTGDGSTTFNLPDSRGRVAVNKNPSDTEFDTIGEKFGEKAHILAGSESGEKGHNHIQDPHGHTSSVQNWYGNRWASSWSSSGPGTDVTIGLHDAGVGSQTATNIAAPASDALSAHNTIQPSIVKVYAIKYRPASGGSSMLPASTSISGYYSSVPSNYLLEDGSAISRTTYSDLFAAIGITYGAGDGSTTFNLPDSRGRVAVNRNPSDTEFDTTGEKYGEKTHLDTIAESGLKGHNHLQNPHTHTTTAQKWYGTRYATSWSSSGPGIDVTIGSHNASVGTTTATNQAVAASNASSAHNTIQPSIVQMFVIKYTPASGSLDKLSKGTSVRGYWTTAPTGYLLEDGSAVSRATYSDLFAVIGTTYGTGDGSTTFNLPDSRGRVAVNKNPSDTEFDTIGEKFGEKTHLLTGAESGEKGHNHIQDAHGHTTTGQNWYGTRWATAWSSTGPGIDVTIGYNAASIDNQTATNQAVADASASSAHNNIQPSIVQNFAIRY